MKKIRKYLISVLAVAIATILILHSMDIRNNVIVGAIIVNSIVAILWLKYINWTLKNNNTAFNVLICTLTTIQMLAIIYFVLWLSIVIDTEKYLQLMGVADKYLIFTIIIMVSTIIIDILAYIGYLICHSKEKNGQ